MKRVALLLALLAACGGGGGTTPPDGAPPADANPPDASGSCADNDDCTGLDDGCMQGVCEEGTCTTAPVADFTGCEDGSFCTVDDICMVGACVAGRARYCASPDDCHLGVCDEDADACGAVTSNDGGACISDEPCAATAVCNAGDCVPNSTIDCSFLNDACNTASCTAGIGCEIAPSNEGGVCSDGLYCTALDHCAAGDCIPGDPIQCTPAGEECQISLCDESTNLCTPQNAGNGSGCDDDNSCTTAETCTGGACGGGTPANPGAQCDDHDACTVGTTCGAGVCGAPTSTIATCTSGDGCCPATCNNTNDSDCLWWASGVQEDVAPSTLVGWTLCYSADYGDTTALSTILATCTGTKLLMACRPTGFSDFTLLAMGDRASVLFDCGTQVNCTSQNNGVGWYFANSYSWGFAPGGEPVNRNSCDYDTGSQTVPDKRMCWHSENGNLATGYRCGTAISFDAGWQRLVYQAP